MSQSHLADFPLQGAALPPRLGSLLEPIGLDPAAKVVVAERHERDPHGPDREHVRQVMAVVPQDALANLGILREALDGLVEVSTPDIREQGGLGEYRPSISGYDYIVAAWGGSSWFAFNLAESVWMTLGLSPRCVGNETQQVMYDDLRLPEFGIAEGEVTSQYHWTSSRDVRWRMRNDYLRRYLWMRGGWGVRAFSYEKVLPDSAELRALMGGEAHARIEGGWYELDLREWRDGGLLLQVAGTTPVVSPDLCADVSAEGLIWPGHDGPMTANRAGGLIAGQPVYLDDRFLERYEQNAAYDSTPVNVGGRWHCSPSYVGQWGFTECVRVGRNMIRVSVRDLYRAIPDREVLHAHRWVLSLDQVAALDPAEPSVVDKVEGLVETLLKLADGLSWLSGAVTDEGISHEEVFKLSAAELAGNGWHSYPALRRLAQVAPLEMTEQAFLSRCKNLHELWQRLPNGLLKQLLIAAGYKEKALKGLGSMKLLQALLNILERLNAEREVAEAWDEDFEADELKQRNERLAPLFLTHELRNADAHDSVGAVRDALAGLNIDVAELNAGYGRALDRVFDAVRASLAAVADELQALRNRSGAS